MTGTRVPADTTATTAADAPVRVSSPLKTKTFWFAVIGAAAHVATNFRDVNTWVEAASIVGAAYGARQAISRNGYGI